MFLFRVGVEVRERGRGRRGKRKRGEIKSNGRAVCRFLFCFGVVLLVLLYCRSGFSVLVVLLVLLSSLIWFFCLGSSLGFSGLVVSWLFCGSSVLVVLSALLALSFSWLFCLGRSLGSSVVVLLVLLSWSLSWFFCLGRSVVVLLLLPVVLLRPTCDFSCGCGEVTKHEQGVSVFFSAEQTMPSVEGVSRSHFRDLGRDVRSLVVPSART